MNCKWCFRVISGDNGPVAHYELTEQVRKQGDPPAGNYCPLCAKQFGLKRPGVKRVSNPYFISQVS